MSGIRRCAKCGELMKIKDAGPEPMLPDGTFPKHLCAKCRCRGEDKPTPKQGA